jgi:hypothetical protein
MDFITFRFNLPVIATTLPERSKSFGTGASFGLERTILKSGSGNENGNPDPGN